MSRVVAVLLVVLAALTLFITPKFTLTSVASTSDPGSPASTTPNFLPPGSWKLVFDDHFTGSSLSSSKWITSFPWGRDGANASELQYYAPDAFVVQNSLNRIKAQKRSLSGHAYTSGIVTSYGKFAMKYGYTEIRVKVPSGKGYWPAFWLLPVTTNWPPEIDVLEILGHEPNKVYMSNHYSVNGQHQSNQGTYVGPNFSAGYHTFGVQWQSGLIIWYVDGVERFRSTKGVPSEPMYLLANLAVGGDWPGNPDASTIFPGYMNIDYIRAYQKNTTALADPWTSMLGALTMLAR